MSDLKSELLAYLKAAEISQLPGDKYRYYYNVLEVHLPHEYSFFIFNFLRLAYIIGVSQTFDSFIDLINKCDTRIVSNGVEYVSLDEIGPIYRSKVEQIIDNPWDDIFELEDTNEFKDLLRLVEGKLMMNREEFQLSLTLSGIPESDIFQFFNTTDGAYYHKKNFLE